MNIRDFQVDGSKRFLMADAVTSVEADEGERAVYAQLTATNTKLMGELQDRLYADGREGLVILLQAMDAAGKDSTIKHVMSGVNPQGVMVHSFKQPSHLELAHDYLWRAITQLPPRGAIGLFNRSYYEDVLIVRVHGLWRDYSLPRRCLHCSEDEFFGRRYRQIRDLEEYLYENGYRVLKVFLNVSKDEQRRRFLARIDNERKNWKFSAADVEERKFWSSYMDAYERTINATSTRHAPWHVIPADQKWLARWLVSEAIVDVLRQMDPRYPTLLAPAKKELEEDRVRLMEE